MPQVTVNGNSLNYEEVGSGPPLVFFAGTRFDSAKAWLPHLTEHAAGFRVISPDLRGMAGSARVRDMSPRDWVDDLNGLLDALSIQSAHVCAETLGTRVAVRLAVEYPAKVNTLVLNSVIAYSYPAGDDQRLRDSDPANMPPERRESLLLHHGGDWQAVNQFYLDVHAKSEFHEYYDLRKIAQSVQAPTLLLRGDVDDPLHPVAHSTEMHSLLPNSWLAIFPNTTFNAWRSRPQESWDLIRKFIAEQGS